MDSSPSSSPSGIAGTDFASKAVFTMEWRPRTLKPPEAFQAGALPISSGNTLPADACFRDVRIDLVRGITLFVIYIDHIPHNVLAWFTLQRFAFIDCAEVFVLISGYVAALVFTRTLVQDGLRACLWRAWRRCGQIYLAHIIVSAITLAIFYAFLLEHVIAPDRNLYTFMEHPYWVAVFTLMLRHMPYSLSILPSFILFIGVAPFLASALRKHRTFPFAILVGVYLATQLIPRANFYLQSYPGHTPWESNLLAWQLVFTLGFLFGDRHLRGACAIRS
jgi:hypothetical protein